MNALAMTLAAALLAGSAPEKVSGETRPVLDLSGEWEGMWRDVRDQRLRQVRIRSGRPGWLALNYCCFSYPFALKADGPETFHGSLVGANVLGIFRQKGDRLTLCFREASKGRPTDFQDNGSQHLIYLERISPRK